MTKVRKRILHLDIHKFFIFILAIFKKGVFFAWIKKINIYSSYLSATLTFPPLLALFFSCLPFPSLGLRFFSPRVPSLIISKLIFMCSTFWYFLYVMFFIMKASKILQKVNK